MEAGIVSKDGSESMEVGGDRGLEDVSSGSDVVECLVSSLSFFMVFCDKSKIQGRRHGKFKRRSYLLLNYKLDSKA